MTPAWRAAWAAGALTCGGVLTANVWVADLSPFTRWGTAYGIAAGVLMLLALGYAARRRMPRRGPFPAHAWLQLHLFSGTFFLVLVLMHSGFRWPAGTLGRALWIFSIWTAATGLIGVVIQWWIPRLLSSGLAIEVHVDRIPALVASSAERAEAIVAMCGESVRRYYRGTLAATMKQPQPRFIYFVDITGGIHARVADFDYLTRMADSAEARRLDELKELFKTKLEMDAHYTLQRALRWWVYAHVPAVGVLLVLVGLHVFTVLYY